MEWVEYTKVNSEITRARERVVTELALSVTVNGDHFVTAMITPMMLKEFVVGHLYTQRKIESIDDIESIEIKGNSAEVKVSVKARKENSPEINSDFRVTGDDIFAGVDAILQSEIYAETAAVHSAGLFKKGAEPVCIVEDIGRHNALDKVIGYALINGIDLTSTFAASTGRMVYEMVSKICRANIPIVATKTAVTKLGVETGEKYGLTIIGFVKNKGSKITKNADAGVTAGREMKIYTHPERIL